MNLNTDDNYLDLLCSYIDSHIESLIKGTLVLKLGPVILRYLYSRICALNELEEVRMIAPVDYFRAYVAEMGDYRRIEKLREYFKLLESIKIVSYGLRDPARISLSPFGRLKNLEIHGCDLSSSSIHGLMELRPHLETLICVDSLEAIRNILVERSVDVNEALPWTSLSTFLSPSNSLIFMDESLFLLPKVKTLDLSCNSLGKVNNLEKCTNLHALDLAFNSISSVDSIGLGLENLRILILRHNALTSTRGLDQLVSLTSLDLAQNVITSMEDIARLSSLKLLNHLFLESNPICFRHDYRVQVLSYFIHIHKFELDGSLASSREGWISSRIKKIREGESWLSFLFPFADWFDSMFQICFGTDVSYSSISSSKVDESDFINSASTIQEEDIVLSNSSSLSPFLFKNQLRFRGRRKNETELQAMEDFISGAKFMSPNTESKKKGKKFKKEFRKSFFLFDVNESSRSNYSDQSQKQSQIERFNSPKVYNLDRNQSQSQNSGQIRIEEFNGARIGLKEADEKCVNELPSKEKECERIRKIDVKSKRNSIDSKKKRNLTRAKKMMYDDDNDSFDDDDEDGGGGDGDDDDFYVQSSIIKIKNNSNKQKEVLEDDEGSDVDSSDVDNHHRHHHQQQQQHSSSSYSSSSSSAEDPYSSLPKRNLHLFGSSVIIPIHSNQINSNQTKTNMIDSNLTSVKCSPSSHDNRLNLSSHSMKKKARRNSFECTKKEFSLLLTTLSMSDESGSSLINEQGGGKQEVESKKEEDKKEENEKEVEEEEREEEKKDEGKSDEKKNEKGNERGEEEEKDMDFEFEGSRSNREITNSNLNLNLNSCRHQYHPLSRMNNIPFQNFTKEMVMSTEVKRPLRRVKRDNRMYNNQNENEKKKYLKKSLSSSSPYLSRTINQKFVSEGEGEGEGGGREEEVEGEEEEKMNAEERNKKNSRFHSTSMLSSPLSKENGLLSNGRRIKLFYERKKEEDGMKEGSSIESIRNGHWFGKNMLSNHHHPLSKDDDAYDNHLSSSSSLSSSLPYNHKLIARDEKRNSIVNQSSLAMEDGWDEGEERSGEGGGGGEGRREDDIELCFKRTIGNRDVDEKCLHYYRCECICMLRGEEASSPTIIFFSTESKMYVLREEVFKFYLKSETEIALRVFGCHSLTDIKNICLGLNMNIMKIFAGSSSEYIVITKNSIVTKHMIHKLCPSSVSSTPISSWAKQQSTHLEREIFEGRKLDIRLYSILEFHPIYVVDKQWKTGSLVATKNEIFFSLENMHLFASELKSYSPESNASRPNLVNPSESSVPGSDSSNPKASNESSFYFCPLVSYLSKDLFKVLIERKNKLQLSMVFLEAPGKVWSNVNVFFPPSNSSMSSQTKEDSEDVLLKREDVNNKLKELSVWELRFSTSSEFQKVFSFLQYLVWMNEEKASEPSPPPPPLSIV